METNEEFEQLYKIVVTGDSNVGKTNIITRFTSNEFSVESKPTIGVEFGHADVKVVDNTTIKVQIWDTAGQERFKAITRGYYRGSVGALIVFDITKASSFRNVDKWLQELLEHSFREIVVMLVGNKSDLRASREVSTEDAKRYAQKNNLLYIETSALDGENIQQAFQLTVQEIYERKKQDQKKNPVGSNPTTTNDDRPNAPVGERIVLKPEDPKKNPPKKGGCC